MVPPTNAAPAVAPGTPDGTKAVAPIATVWFMVAFVGSEITGVVPPVEASGAVACTPVTIFPGVALAASICHVPCGAGPELLCVQIQMAAVWSITKSPARNDPEVGAPLVVPPTNLAPAVAPGNPVALTFVPPIVAVWTISAEESSEITGVVPPVDSICVAPETPVTGGPGY